MSEMNTGSQQVMNFSLQTSTRLGSQLVTREIHIVISAQSDVMIVHYICCCDKLQAVIC